MAPHRAHLPLIARSPESALIRSLLDDRESDEPRTLIFRGEGGVGKSRLLQSAVEEADRRGWRIASGRSYPVESGIPYALFADALLPFVRRLTADELSVATRGREDDLAYLFPFLSSGAHTAEPVREHPAEARLRRLWSFAEFLRTLADQQPLLLVLDDLQWADDSSLELLHFVARQPADPLFALICAFNTEHAERSRTLATVQSLTGAGTARVHTVGPLSRSDTEELVGSALQLDARTTHDLSVRLFDWTRGNPFFLQEILKVISRSEWLPRQGGKVRLELDDFELPATIREAMLSRLMPLSTSAREHADLLAVVGTSISHGALRAVSGDDEEQLVGAVEELRLARVVEERMEGETLVYDLAHPILQETLYGELGLARARLLHATVGEALERWYGGAAAENAGSLAYHFARSTERELPHKAIRYLMLAGCSALDRFANREAAEYLSSAVSRGGKAAENVPGLLENLSRARQRLGEFREAAELAERLRRDAVERGDPLMIARAERRLGLIAYRSGDHHEALERLGSAIEWAERAENPLLSARLRLVTGECLLELGRADEASRRIEEALEIAQRSDDRELLARVHLSLLFLHSWTGPPQRARMEGARALELASEVGDTALRCTVHWGLTVLAGLTGDPVAAAEHGAASARLAEELGSPLHRLRSAELEIELLTNSGDWDQALDVADRTIDAARALNQRTSLPRILVSTALVHLGRGDLEQARSLVNEAWELAGARGADGTRDVHTVVPVYAGQVAYHLWAGELDAAVRIGREGLAIADRTGYTAWSIHRLLPLLAQAYLSMGDVENATGIGRRLRIDSQRLGHKLGLAWADACDALLVWLQGDIRAGTEQMREAARRLEAIPAIPDATRLRRHIAARLRDQGEREEALGELRQIHDIFLRLGAEQELTKTREQIRELGARPPPRETPPGGIHGLSSRETEIARLVAAGRTNKAIARTLDISARTVSTHLSNIFRKLEIGSRSELGEVMQKG